MKIISLTPAFAEVLAHMHAKSCVQNGGWNAQSIASTLATQGTFGLMASRDDTPLGFVLMRVIMFGKNGGETEVLSLATLPIYRRSGVARTLIKASCARAHDSGAQKAFLEVAEDNASACALYKSLGFVPAGRRKAYYARPLGRRVDAVVMEKTLGN